MLFRPTLETVRSANYIMKYRHRALEAYLLNAQATSSLLAEMVANTHETVNRSRLLLATAQPGVKDVAPTSNSLPTSAEVRMAGQG